MNVSVDVPQLVRIPTSELGRLYGVGRVVAAWSNNIKVVWTDDSGVDHLGIYSILKHAIQEVRE